MMPQPQVVIVGGCSGCGKSLVAGDLAAQWSARFLEGDAFHPPENIVRIRLERKPLQDQHRWPWFDRLVREAERLVGNGERVVVSCSALRRRYRDRLRFDERVHVFLIDVGKCTLAARLQTRGGWFPPELLPSQLEALEPPTADEPGVTVIDGHRPSEEIVTEILRHLGTVALAGTPDVLWEAFRADCEQTPPVCRGGLPWTLAASQRLVQQLALIQDQWPRWLSQGLAQAADALTRQLLVSELLVETGVAAGEPRSALLLPWGQALRLTADELVRAQPAWGTQRLLLEMNSAALTLTSAAHLGFLGASRLAFTAAWSALGGVLRVTGQRTESELAFFEAANREASAQRSRWRQILGPLLADPRRRAEVFRGARLALAASASFWAALADEMTAEGADLDHEPESSITPWGNR